MASQTTRQLATEVLDELSAMVLRIGPLLDQAFENYPDFTEWVIENLPLHPHTAERIRAYWHLHQFREGHPDLPPPWQACWLLD